MEFEQIKDILIGEGLGSFKFGTLKETIKERIGSPDEIDLSDDDEDGRVEDWHFDNYEMSFSFVEDDGWRLVQIAVSSPDIELEGEKLIGRPKKEIIAIIKDLNLGDYIVEKLDSEGQEVVIVDDSSINFWLENNVLSDIQWGII